MNPQRYSRLIDLCQAAWALAPEPRLDFLSDACGDDPNLRWQVEAMLEADRHAEPFLRAPPYNLVSAALAALPASCSPGDVLGDYRIIARLGAGGMAEVFLAQDGTLDRRVALKVLSGEFNADSAWLTRLQREARAVSKLNHPNILTVYGFGEAKGVHYLATELVEGPTLRQIMDNGPLKPLVAIEIAIQVASALQAAHEAGVVHRDIKPENIVQRSDGLVKVLDFGIAEHAGQKQDLAGIISGTPQYMSPEQAAGHPTDARTDLFSLGLVLYEMLAGHPAFSGSTVSGTIDQVLSRQPAPLKLNASKCPPRLARAVEKAIAKDCEKRFPTAREMRAELELARRQVSRRLTRHPVLTAVCAAIVSGIAIFATYDSLRSPAAAPSIRSLAVLPLEDLSHNESHAYFSDGITEQLIADLSRLNGVRVISRSSVMSFKLSRKPLREIADELNVDALITGSIAGSAARVRINTELTSLRPQRKVWAESYERSVDELPSLQLEVATTIAHQVRKSLPLEARSQTSKVSRISAEARDLYYMGKYNANKANEEGYLKAIGFFEKAVAKSPFYAAAYGGLAYAYAQLSSLAFHYMSPLDGMPKAKAAALKALELDDTLADVHTWLGFVKLTFDRDWTGAEHEIRRALALNPNSADAHVVREWYLVAMRRFDEAHQEIERARELDPLSLRAVNEDQWVKIGAGRYGEAIELGTKAIKAEPQFVPAMFSNAFAYTEKGNFPKAISLAQNAIRLHNVPSNVLLLAHVVARAGDYEWAERLIAHQKKTVNIRYLCPYEVATAYVSMNRKKEAYEWLGKAVRDRVDCMIYLQAEPWMDSLRQDSEYRRLLDEMKLPAN